MGGEDGDDGEVVFPSDRELLARAREDPESFGTFYDRHVQAVAMLDDRLLIGQGGDLFLSSPGWRPDGRPVGGGG